MVRSGTWGGQPARRVGYHLFWLWPRARFVSNAGFFVPTDIAVGPDGTIHVADSGNHRVVMLSATGEYQADWAIPDADSNIFSPEQIAASPDGSTVYATDLGPQSRARAGRRPTFVSGPSKSRPPLGRERPACWCPS